MDGSFAITTDVIAEIHIYPLTKKARFPGREAASPKADRTPRVRRCLPTLSNGSLDILILTYYPGWRPHGIQATGVL
jgi:hypothetical protein